MTTNPERPDRNPRTLSSARGEPARWSRLLVLVSLLVVTALHYGTPREPEFHALHDVWRRLYYVPIVLGAFHFGLRGGVLTAALVTVVYLPHVLLQWGGMATGNQYLEIVMFNVMGLITGSLAGELHARREQARRAYERLAESFERSRETERLAAMGQLSAALSHEIRNPLASLKGSMPILLEAIAVDDERRQYADLAQRELDRLQELTTQFLEYARPPEPRWAEDSLNDVATSVARLVGREAERAGVEIRLELDSTLPLTWMDSNRIRQAVLNLVLNGIQAMQHGGRLWVRTRARDGGIELVVADEGPGIEPSARSRLFEPFFTTKSTGTGLGLAVAHQWVEKHGGRLEAEEAGAGGATFVLTLPIRGEAPSAGATGTNPAEREVAGEDAR